MTTQTTEGGGPNGVAMSPSSMLVRNGEGLTEAKEQRSVAEVLVAMLASFSPEEIRLAASAFVRQEKYDAAVAATQGATATRLWWSSAEELVDQMEREGKALTEIAQFFAEGGNIAGLRVVEKLAAARDEVKRLEAEALRLNVWRKSDSKRGVSERGVDRTAEEHAVHKFLASAGRKLPVSKIAEETHLPEPHVQTALLRLKKQGSVAVEGDAVTGPIWSALKGFIPPIVTKEPSTDDPLPPPKKPRAPRKAESAPQVLP